MILGPLVFGSSGPLCQSMTLGHTEAGAIGLLAYLAHVWKHMVLGVGGHRPNWSWECFKMFQDEFNCVVMQPQVVGFIAFKFEVGNYNERAGRNLCAGLYG